MNTRKTRLFILLLVLLAPFPLFAQTARSTPVTVVNEEANPVPVNVVGGTAGGTVEWRFAGTSDAAVPGDAGYTGLNAACQGTFGPQARLCTSEEFMNSPEVTTPLPVTAFIAWVRPVFVLSYVDSTGDVGVMDAGGVRRALTETLNCNGWTSTSNFQSGLVVNRVSVIEKLIFNTDLCNATHPVTCCTPR